jgi:hypothetical protein
MCLAQPTAAALRSGEPPRRLPLPTSGYLLLRSEGERPEVKKLSPIEALTLMLNRMQRPRPEQQELLTVVLGEAIHRLQQKIIKLKASNPDELRRVNLFFGFTMSKEGVIAGLNLIKKRLQAINANHRVLIDPKSENTNTLAFVVPSVSAAYPTFMPFIFVSPRFFQLSPETMLCVVVHEAAHLVLNVLDQPMGFGEGAYGLINAVDLAGIDPTRAVENAENWALFVIENAPDRLLV